MGTALVGLCSVMVAALVARQTAVGMGELSARQKHRDAEILAAKQYADAVIECAGAVRSYNWFAEHYEGQRDLQLAYKSLLEDASNGLHRVEYLVKALHNQVLTELTMKMVHVGRAILADVDPDRPPTRIYNDAADAGVFTGVVEAAYEHHAELIRTYPTAAPSLVPQRVRDVFAPLTKR